MKRVSALAIALVAGIFVAQCSPQSAATTSTSPASAASPTNSGTAPVGSVAPTFTGTGLDGAKIATADYAGKVLVLNFWATWCPPCRAETPDMIGSYAKLHGDDVAFLGVDTSEAAQVVRTFTSIRGVPYPTALGKSADYNAFGISALPTTIVIDAKGIVRARWIGGIEPARLASYVADARAGRDATFETPEQKKLDAMLAVAQFTFSGTPAQIAATVAKASKQLDAVGTYLGKLDALPTVRYDYERTLTEQGALELATAQAQSALAKTPKQKLDATEALANAYGDSNRWADAAATYKGALALHPKDAKLVGLVTRSYYRLHDYPAMAANAALWTKLGPNDSDAWDNAGLAQERAGNFAAAVAPYEKTVALLKKDADTQAIGKDGEAVTFVADESLDLADVYVALGDAKNAARVFASAKAYADKIPAGSRYNAMKPRVPERTTEGMAAVAMAHGGGTNLSLTKWTGADLPGSVKSTLKYRLVVVGSPNQQVALAAKGLKPGWVASFCADGLCSPGGVKATLPGIGVKTYEFQLVPPENGAAPGDVSVTADGTREVAVPG
jgi:thiol-disulfide isomerase/thioredoxin